MLENVYLYILVMAGVTYLIRVLPLTLIRQQIKSQFIQSFLHYVPYATLSAMTFPAILTSTSSMIAATGGFIVAMVAAWKERSLVQVAAFACITVFILERFL
ncbi:MAG: AzlD domain-containing protein [Firmicutes bacterium]|nr:AzlD domain-containing protein [Bacillota bacterium]